MLSRSTSISSRGKSIVNEPPVVNASPLIYLAHANLLDLLQVAGQKILVPSPVAGEIRRRGPADPTVRAMEAASWLQEVEPVEVSARVRAWDLGPGETSVLSWAQSHAGCVAILDDLAGRRCAEVLKIPLIGTLGLVLKGKRTGQVSAARPLLTKLREAGMYLSDRVLEPALRLVGE
jgi:predicted nucleic acid-binding protein